MKNKVLILLVICLLGLSLMAQESDLIATTEDGRKVLLKADGTWKFLSTIIVIVDYSAPLRPSPNETKTMLIRIPVGVELAVLETRTIHAGMTTVRWHKVKYISVVGWISEYCCKPVKEKDEK